MCQTYLVPLFILTYPHLVCKFEINFFGINLLSIFVSELIDFCLSLIET